MVQSRQILNFDWITVSPKENAKWRQRSGNS